MDENNSSPEQPINQNENTTEILAQPSSSQPQNETTNYEPLSSGPPAPLNPQSSPEPGKKKRYHFKPRIDFMFPAKVRAKLGKFSIPLACLLLVMVLAGSSALAYGTFFNKTKVTETEIRLFAIEEPFLFLESNPTNGDFNADRGKPIVLKFSKPADLASIKANTYFTPQLEGSYSYGDTEKDIVFTPENPFNEGTTVSVKMGANVASTSGELLGLEQEITFTTSLAQDKVYFESEGLFYSSLFSTLPSKKTEFKIHAGTGVDKNGTISIYKSTTDNLLRSFTYSLQTKTYNDFTFTENDYLYDEADISGLTPVMTHDGLGDTSTFSFEQPAGTYVIVASSGGKQNGHAWVTVTDKGLITQLDDSKLIATGVDLTTNENVDAKLNIYSLQNKHKLLQSYDLVSSVGEISLNSSSTADIVVAEIASQYIVVPLNVYLSQAHIRTSEDFSKKYTASLFTDKEAYRSGDTVKLSGFIRTDNDVHYAVPSSKSVTLFGKSSESIEGSYFEVSATIDDLGRYNAQTTVKPDWVESDRMDVFLKSPNGNDTLIGSIALQKSPNSNSSLNVAFTKESYIASDTISAKITGKKADGSPLNNAKVTFNIFTHAYYENQPQANTYEGQLVGDKDRTITLDESGSAMITVESRNFKSTSSQLVTIQTSTDDGTGQATTSSGDAIVNAGNGYVTFGSMKSYYTKDEEMVTRVYTKQLNGQALPNTAVQYSFNTTKYSTETNDVTYTPFFSGTTKTDADGYVEIRRKLAPQGEDSSITVIVQFTDEYNNKVQNFNSFYYNDGTLTSFDPHEAQLFNLDVSGTDKYQVVGDTITLTINSPFDTTALVSTARGRIYAFESMSLKTGANTKTINVDADLAPSFTVWFNYFYKGRTYIEGVVINVNDPNTVTKITSAMSKATYSAGEVPVATITSKPSSALLIKVVDDTSFRNNSVLGTSRFENDWNKYRETTIQISSSSMGIGSGGGGRCGGHGSEEYTPLINRDGPNLYYSTSVITDSSGQATIELPSKKGDWRVIVQSATGPSQFGSTQSSFTIN